MDENTLSEKEKRRQTIRKARSVLIALLCILVISCSLLAVAVVFSIGSARSIIESMPDNENQSGLMLYNLKTVEGYKSAKSNFKSAVFCEKYIVFWNDNAYLPTYYFNLAQTELNLEDYDSAIKHYTRALGLFEKYDAGNKDNIYTAHAMLTLIYSKPGHQNFFNVKKNGLEAIAILSEMNLETSTAAAMMNLLIANASYLLGEYAEAITYYQRGIPMFYYTVDWGSNDIESARMLTISYYNASLTAAALGDKPLSLEYQKKYDDMIWLREFTENELNDYATHMGLHYQL